MMPGFKRSAALLIFAVGVIDLVFDVSVAADTNTSAHGAAAQTQISGPVAAPPKARPDLSGRSHVGKASFYAHSFAGKTMADGARMNPRGDNAASKTLPLGTTAKVTNLDTGKSAVVTIQDRGPYVKGRIVDLSPSTAQKIGITPDDGVAKVRVAPIEVPLPDGRIKPGVAALDSQREGQVH